MDPSTAQTMASFTGTLLRREHTLGQKFVKLVFRENDRDVLCVSTNPRTVTLAVGQMYRVQGAFKYRGERAVVFDPKIAVLKKHWRPIRRVVFGAILVSCVTALGGMAYMQQRGNTPAATPAALIQAVPASAHTAASVTATPAAAPTPAPAPVTVKPKTIVKTAAKTSSTTTAPASAAPTAPATVQAAAAITVTQPTDTSTTDTSGSTDTSNTDQSSSTDTSTQTPADTQSTTGSSTSS